MKLSAKIGRRLRKRRPVAHGDDPRNLAMDWEVINSSWFKEMVRKREDRQLRIKAIIEEN